MDMTAPATSSGKLPRSKFYQSSILSTPAPTLAPAAPPPDLAHGRELPAEPIANHTGLATYPGCVTPSHDYRAIQNLVIVCCHAIFHPDPGSPDFPLYSPYQERNWHLAPFQVSNPDTGKPGEHETFLAHTLAGIDALTCGALAESSLLVISGGATKVSLTPLSEARSYYHAALAHELAQGSNARGRAQLLFDNGRILLEEHATDSFQNLLFSILQFRRATGRYPRQIRIITHAFKAKRFLDLHAAAIAWPAMRVQVHGIDPVMSSSELDEAMAGERDFAYKHWAADPMGTGETLSYKRKQRGWDESVTKAIGNDLEESVSSLLQGKAHVINHLPWSTQTSRGKAAKVSD